MVTLITASIPYVNASPHLGYAYELVQADITARALRARGTDVWFSTGTDDNSLKNVLAAEAAGEAVAPFVDRHARQFAELHSALGLSVDDVVHTSRDPRHLAAVERIWRAASDNGDLYRRSYRGLYCVGCEQFWRTHELTDGRCPEHGSAPEAIEENNWFFRLSAYQEHLRDLITTDALEIRPEGFRREVLAFIDAGLDDISVSRSAQRARGWGIPVPDDPEQVIYVWFDALTNYLTTLDGGDPEVPGGWATLDDRIHVVGKGITRFHAIYWPAFLAAAGEPPPTHIRVHPYLTLDGQKISKSGRTGAEPVQIIDIVSSDVLRWYFARDIAETSDTDVTIERIVARANDELANGIANATNRLLSLVHRHLGGHIARAEPDPEIGRLCRAASDSLVDFDQRAGAASIAAAVHRLNADISRTEPWIVARDLARTKDLADILALHLAGARAIATALAPICPQLAHRLHHQLDGEPLPPPSPTFRRITR